MRRSVLVYNPAAGRRRQRRLLAELLPVLEAGGFVVDPVGTRAPGDATGLARQGVEGGAEVVFVLGGDGTVRETAAALTGGDVPLAILPGGTTNVLSHALGVPADPVAAARAYGAPGREDRPVRRVDVGLCSGLPFLMMASGGFDAFVLDHLDPGWKVRLGKAGIALQGLMQLPRYRFPALELVVDGEPERATFFAVCNIPFYAGTFELCPPATCDDRCLDLVTFTGEGPLATVGFSLDVLRGAHPDRPDVAVRRVERVEVRGPDAASVQIDGDPSGATLPVVLELGEHTLPVLAPAAT